LAVTVRSRDILILTARTYGIDTPAAAAFIAARV
jgi:hypothetical protein